MLRWAEKKWLEKTNQGRADICKHCIWWKSDEMFGQPFKKHASFCGLIQKYTAEYASCSGFQEELFEATENSTQTEIILDWEIETKKD